MRRSESRRMVKEAKASARAYQPTAWKPPQPLHLDYIHAIGQMQLANEGIITRREAMERIPF
jgi:hypothetical protein